MPKPILRPKQPAQIPHLRSDPRNRFVELPLRMTMGRPLQVIGLRVAGVDHLRGEFLAGAEISPSHLLWFAAKGEVKCDYGDGWQALRAGQMLIAPARGPHWVRHGRGYCKGLWFHLYDLPRWEFLLADKPVIRAARTLPELEYAVDQCLKESLGDDPVAHAIARRHAENIVDYLLRELGHGFASEEHRAKSRLQRLWAEVDSELPRRWTTTELAGRAQMSVSHLTRLCRRHMGRAPLGVITHLRIERAMDLLAHTDDTLESVAEQIGYKNPYIFSRAFFREIGQRPGIYRRNFQAASS